MRSLRASLAPIILSVLAACEGDQAQLAKPDAGLDGGIDAQVDAPPDPIDDDGDGYAADDCNDSDPAVNPGAVETCNGVDDNCAGGIDEGALATFNDGTTTVNVTELAAGTEAAPVAYTPPGPGVLELCTGTYYAHITASADLEIIGKSPMTTVLHGGGLGAVVAVTGAQTTVRLEKVQITQGMPGVSCNGATLAVVDSALVGNAATGANGGGASLVNCTATITGSTIEGNMAAQGGGLFVTSGSVTLDGTRVADNSSTGAGGGIHVTGQGNTVRLNVNNGSVVTGNASTNAQGGGIHVAGGVACNNAEVTANTGHGVYVAAAQYTSTTCDYGTDAASDNTPSDVRPANAVGGSEFGNDASFSCNALLCN